MHDDAEYQSPLSTPDGMLETSGTCRDQIVCTPPDCEPEWIALGRQINDLSQWVQG